MNNQRTFTASFRVSVSDRIRVEVKVFLITETFELIDYLRVFTLLEDNA